MFGILSMHRRGRLRRPPLRGAVPRSGTRGEAPYFCAKRKSAPRRGSAFAKRKRSGGGLPHGAHPERERAGADGRQL